MNPTECAFIQRRESSESTATGAKLIDGIEVVEGRSSGSLPSEPATSLMNNSPGEANRYAPKASALGLTPSLPSSNSEVEGGVLAQPEERLQPHDFAVHHGHPHPTPSLTSSASFTPLYMTQGGGGGSKPPASTASAVGNPMLQRKLQAQAQGWGASPSSHSFFSTPSDSQTASTFQSFSLRSALIPQGESPASAAAVSGMGSTITAANGSANENGHRVDGIGLAEEAFGAREESRSLPRGAALGGTGSTPPPPAKAKARSGFPSGWVVVPPSLIVANDLHLSGSPGSGLQPSERSGSRYSNRSSSSENSAMSSGSKTLPSSPLMHLSPPSLDTALDGATGPHGLRLPNEPSEIATETRSIDNASSTINSPPPSLSMTLHINGSNSLLPVGGTTPQGNYSTLHPLHHDPIKKIPSPGSTGEDHPKEGKEIEADKAGQGEAAAMKNMEDRLRTDGPLRGFSSSPERHDLPPPVPLKPLFKAAHRPQLFSQRLSSEANHAGFNEGASKPPLMKRQTPPMRRMRVELSEDGKTLYAGPFVVSAQGCLTVENVLLLNPKSFKREWQPGLTPSLSFIASQRGTAGAGSTGDGKGVRPSSANPTLAGDLGQETPQIFTPTGRVCESWIMDRGLSMGGGQVHGLSSVLSTVGEKEGDTTVTDGAVRRGSQGKIDRGGSGGLMPAYGDGFSALVEPHKRGSSISHLKVRTPVQSFTRSLRSPTAYDRVAAAASSSSFTLHSTSMDTPYSPINYSMDRMNFPTASGGGLPPTRHTIPQSASSHHPNLLRAQCEEDEVERELIEADDGSYRSILHARPAHSPIYGVQLTSANSVQRAPQFPLHAQTIDSATTRLPRPTYRSLVHVKPLRTDSPALSEPSSSNAALHIGSGGFATGNTPPLSAPSPHYSPHSNLKHSPSTEPLRVPGPTQVNRLRIGALRGLGHPPSPILEGERGTNPSSTAAATGVGSVGPCLLSTASTTSVKPFPVVSPTQSMGEMRSVQRGPLSVPSSPTGPAPAMRLNPSVGDFDLSQSTPTAGSLLMPYSDAARHISANVPARLAQTAKTVRYEDLELHIPVGEGASATVSVSIHKPTGRRLAVKHVDLTPLNFSWRRRPTAASSDSQYSGDRPAVAGGASARARQLELICVRELQVLHLTYRSPFMVKVYNAFYIEETMSLDIIMEFMHYGSLDNLAKSLELHESEQQQQQQHAGALPRTSSDSEESLLPELKGVDERLVAVVGEQLLRGVRDMHSRGFIHRDIKPGNVLVNEHGVVKLSDFGLSQSCGGKEGEDEAQTSMVSNRSDTPIIPFHADPSPACPSDGTRSRQSGAAFAVDDDTSSDEDIACSGTDLYMSPERQRGERHGKPSDIWAVGVTLAEFAVGEYPYDLTNCEDAFDKMSRSSKPLDLSSFNAKRNKALSEKFLDFARLATMPNPADRPTAKVLLEHPFFRQWDSPFNLKEYLLERVTVPSNAIKEEYMKKLQQENGL